MSVAWEKVVDVRLGTRAVRRVYEGETLVWEKAEPVTDTTVQHLYTAGSGSLGFSEINGTGGAEFEWDSSSNALTIDQDIDEEV